jgi:hypothetical protein
MEEDNSKSSSPSSFSLDNKNKNKPAARIPAWKLREQQKPRRESDGTLSTRTMTTTARYHNGNGNRNRNSSSSSNMSLCSNSTLSSNASSHVSRHSLAFRRRGPLDPSLPPAFRAAALRDSSFSGLPHDDGLSTLGGSVTSNDKFLCEDDSAADDDDDDDSDLSDCDSFASLDSDADDDDEAYSASRNQMARSLVENRPLRRSKHKSRFHSDSKGVHGIPLYIIAECSEHGGR